MKAKDLEQGKYYTSVVFGSNGEVLMQRWWHITLREGDNIRVRLLEKVENPLNISYISEMSLRVTFFKDIFFMEV